MTYTRSGLSQPTTYDAAEYFYLRGTSTNATHWTLTTLCRGCTAWSSNDESIASIHYTGTSNVACAQAKAPVVGTWKAAMLKKQVGTNSYGRSQ